MRRTLHANNLKCDGCMACVLDKLGKIEGVSNVEVNMEKCQVIFDAVDDLARDSARAALDKMGYTEDEPTFVQTAKSYVSCMVGRTK